MLVAIGKEMRDRLAKVEKGHAKRVLFGGLVVVLERRHETWRLAVGRQRVPPSQTEVATVARDFALPAGLEWTWTIKKNQARKVVYQVAECRWIEREELVDENSGDL